MKNLYVVIVTSMLLSSLPLGNNLSCETLDNDKEQTKKDIILATSSVTYQSTESSEEKEPIPKIEKQDILITGEDKSGVEDKEERISIIKPLGKVEIPTAEPVKTDVTEMLPEPEMLKTPEYKITTPPKKRVIQPPLYAFSFSYGKYETLAYEFSHFREIEKLSYCFSVKRERSDGFRYGTIASRFDEFSKDELTGESVIYFKGWSLRTGISYFNNTLVLPYLSKHRNKREKSGFVDYEVRISNGSSLKLGLEFGRYMLGSMVDTDRVSGHLKFVTPFKPESPPIAIGTKVSHEKVSAGKESYDMGYYSLYAESRHIKVMNNTTLDIKVALDGYKDGFTISQVDYMIIGAYSWKPDIVFHGSIERKLELPEFRQAYIIQDYMDINSECLPQKIARSKLSCSWHLSEEVSLTGSIFAGQIKDYITWELATNTATLSTDTPAGMLYEPVNIGDISIIGIELGLKHNLTEKLSQSINFIHSSYKNKTNGNNVVPYVPETTLSIGLKYVDDNHLMVSLEGEYVSKRYVTCEDKNKTLRSYFLVNLYGNKQVNDTLSIVFSWENILNETYEIRAGYPGMPCTATVGLHLKF